MPGWQRFQEEHGNEGFEIVTIAVDNGGAEAARPFVERARATFPTLIDEEGVTSRLFDFKVVPNGLLVDEEGKIRYAQYGGFSIDRSENVAAVERFARGEEPGESPASDLPYRLGPVEQELVQTRIRLGHLLNEMGRQEEAIAEWQKALHIDPGNFTIRKQIWAARYPEKFYPTIDFEWQKEQLRREREEEIAAGICGPDGCPLPQR